ncbi:MAG: flagellar basal body-associated FliL family protein [Desulfotomaculaceae bacterium]|nr:flagellar basal body-associated FliL family protein [Desulfotomaculaceae bacterium]
MPKIDLSAKDGAKMASAETRPKKKKTFLIIMVVLLILAGTSAGAYPYFRQPPVPAGKIRNAAQNDSLDMGELIMNLNGSGHYLRVKVVIEYPRDKRLTAELQKKKHTVADAIITTLRSKTYAEVSMAESVQALKSSIAEEINGHLAWGEITGVFFTDFLIQ